LPAPHERVIVTSAPSIPPRPDSVYLSTRR